MRMLLNYSVLALSAASFLAAQLGGGGHGGGGHVGGGGGGFHASPPATAPAARSFSGGGYSAYGANQAVVPPASYGGHLTFSTPGMPGTYGNSIRYGQSILSGFADLVVTPTMVWGFIRIWDLAITATMAMGTTRTMTQVRVRLMHIRTSMHRSMNRQWIPLPPIHLPPIHLLIRRFLMRRIQISRSR